MNPDRKKDLQKAIAFAQLSIGLLMLITGCLHYFDGSKPQAANNIPLIILGVVLPLMAIATLRHIKADGHDRKAD